MWPQLKLGDLEYQPVRLSGVFHHEHEVLVFEPAGNIAGELVARGFYVLTPLQLVSGAIVMINRGFVTDDYADPERRKAGQISGEQTITGLLRQLEAQGVEFKDLQTKQSSLEEIFVNLVKEPA